MVFSVKPKQSAPAPGMAAGREERKRARKSFYDSEAENYDNMEAKSTEGAIHAVARPRSCGRGLGAGGEGAPEGRGGGGGRFPWLGRPWWGWWAWLRGSGAGAGRELPARGAGGAPAPCRGGTAAACGRVYCGAVVRIRDIIRTRNGGQGGAGTGGGEAEGKEGGRGRKTARGPPARGCFPCNTIAHPRA